MFCNNDNWRRERELSGLSSACYLMSALAIVPSILGIFEGWKDEEQAWKGKSLLSPAMKDQNMLLTFVIRIMPG